MKSFTRSTVLLPRVRTCASLFVLSALAPAAVLAQGQAGQEGSQQQSSSQAASQPPAGHSGNEQKNQQAHDAKDEASAGQHGQAKMKGPNPYAKADDSWISISGTVDMVERDAFTLNYGNGSVRVEMDDRDRDAEAYTLREGDKITVNGLIDDDLFETTKIEASSVYVDKLGTTFYASALDEEDFYVVTYMARPDDFAAVHGLVTEVSGDEFTIDNGPVSIKVDAEEMAYNPLDNDGYQKVEVGDVVRVTGEIDNGFFDGREIKANTITTLVEELG
jgi:uncharacterized protein YdeI (BOF family)